eukprot:9494419-Pyramimonas_sp.AAC.1
MDRTQKPNVRSPHGDVAAQVLRCGLASRVIVGYFNDFVLLCSTACLKRMCISAVAVVLVLSRWPAACACAQSCSLGAGQKKWLVEAHTARKISYTRWREQGQGVRWVLMARKPAHFLNSRSVNCFRDLVG